VPAADDDNVVHNSPFMKRSTARTSKYSAAGRL
jgi:hypothetical protein